MSLNSPEVTELNSETGPLALLHEWLAFYFDGGAHAVGLQTPVTFPLVSIAFGQGAPGKPMEAANGVEIRVVVHPLAECSTPVATSLYIGNLVRSDVLVHFWVTAKAQGKGKSERLRNQVLDLLKAILSNPSCRLDLAEKGLVNVHPRKGKMMESGDYAEGMLPCLIEVQYPVLYDADQPAPIDGAESLLPFLVEDVLVPGEYLLGTYQLAVATKAIFAKVTGWASQGVPTVLELEVGGVLTGMQLTLPVGPENTDVADELVMSISNLIIGRTAAIRWKVISGPEPERAAWHVSLMMRVKAQS